MSVAAVGKTSPITDVPPRPQPVIPHTAPGVLEGLGDDRLNSVLGKCLAMLDAIDRSRAKSLTGAELSRASGVPKASCHLARKAFRACVCARSRSRATDSSASNSCNSAAAF